MGTENPLSVLGPPAKISQTEVYERIPLIWDEGNQRSIFNLLPPAVVDLLKDARDSNPELFEMSEEELLAHLKSERRLPQTSDHRARYSFWNEYDRAQQGGIRMLATSIYSGKFSKQYFYNKFLRNPHKVAWMLSVPATYEEKMDEALDFGISQMRAILALDHGGHGEGKKKKPLDYKLMALKFKLIQHLDIRRKGATIHRIQTENVNINTNFKEVQKMRSAPSMEVLNEKLAKLESATQLGGLGAGVQKALEVNPVEGNGVENDPETKT